MFADPTCYRVITRDRTLDRLEESERTDKSWPKYSERFLTPMFEDILRKGNLTVEKFLANRGDVLIWHTRLMHRGSPPANFDLWREAVILHYSGIFHRPDMRRAPAIQHPNGGWYFPISVPAIVSRTDRVLIQKIGNIWKAVFSSKRR